MPDKLQQTELEELQDVELNEEAEERFKIVDKDKLSWTLRKIATFKSLMEENKQLADKEIARIEEWLEKENKTLQNHIAFFEGLIMQYAEERRKNDPDFKSVKTPYGKVTYKKQQPEWKYDNDPLLEYLKETGKTDLIRVKEEPNKNDIKVAFEVQNGHLINTETGEIVPGVVIKERGEKIDINPEGV